MAEHKLNINADFSLYINTDRELSDADKQMIGNALRLMLQKEFCSTVANRMTNFYNVDHSVSTADNDYIDVKVT